MNYIYMSPKDNTTKKDNNNYLFEENKRLKVCFC